MPNDPWKLRVSGISAPARSAAVVTPSDTVDLPEVTRALHIDVAGDIAVIMADDTTSVTLKDVGGDVAYMVKRVLATGTTATDIVALY